MCMWSIARPVKKLIHLDLVLLRILQNLMTNSNKLVQGIDLPQGLLDVYLVYSRPFRICWTFE
jgi:hypothetical protein